MWRTTRYEIILYGMPVHKPADILLETTAMLNRYCGKQLVWQLGGQSGRPAPTNRNEWSVLEQELRDKRYGSLDLFLESPFGLTMSLGVDAPAFVRRFDVLSIGFDPQDTTDLEPMLSFDRLLSIFTYGIRLFRAFNAQVSDRELVRKDKAGNVYLSVDVTRVPDVIHWFNYFDNRIVESLGGRDKLLKAPAYVTEVIGDPPGILVILQREPFDYHNPEHRQRWREITDYLNLEQLHRLYPKQR